MAKKGPEPLNKILEKVLGKIQRQKEERARISNVLDQLNLIFGKKVSSHVKPLRIYKKRLIIIVNAPVYLQELLFKKEKIIEAVNRTFNKEAIEDISFRVGESR